MSPEDVRSMLNHDSGLKGISGVSNDVRDVLEAEKAGNDRAKLAMSIYIHQIQQFIGAYTTDLEGLETLVFTAGVGEHSAPVRSRVCASLGYLGVEIDEDKNLANDFEISTPNSRVKVLVIPTDEELIIARDTLKIVGA